MLGCKAEVAPSGDGSVATVVKAAASPSANATTHYARATECPDSALTVAAARTYAVDKDWPSALAAFDDVVRARPLDARMRAERGYALLLSGDAAHAKVDLMTAARLTDSRVLLAQIYLTLGDVSAALGDVEASRVAFAIAEHDGSEAAKAKLGARSHCPASFRVGKGASEGGLIVWKQMSTDSIFGDWRGGNVPAADSDAFVTGDSVWSDAPAGSPCRPDLGKGQHGAPRLTDLAFETTQWVEAKTRDPVFSLTVYRGKVTATVRRHMAHLSGEGCEGDVPIP
jgi:hypothetical protein